jgi:hypothetical protein
MKKQIETESPQNYLSQTEEGWCVISHGMPLCAVTTKEKAIEAASLFKLKLPSIFWDGIRGDFTEEKEISCSQCGRGFGLGETGYSHCKDHS